MSTVLLIQPFGLVVAFTLLPPIARRGWPALLGKKLGGMVWTSSDKPGTPVKPGVFYLLEDLGAVDFREGRAWRGAVNER